MANWKASFVLATGLTGLTATTSLAGSCDYVFQAEVPFCREECGQDKSLLQARRSVLRQALEAADVNGDGRVAAEIITTARQDETQPERFVKGRGKFLAREAGRIKTLSPVEHAYQYTSGEPLGIVRAADTKAQLQACPK